MDTMKQLGWRWVLFLPAIAVVALMVATPFFHLTGLLFWGGGKLLILTLGLAISTAGGALKRAALPEQAPSAERRQAQASLRGSGSRLRAEIFRNASMIFSVAPAPDWCAISGVMKLIAMLNGLLDSTGSSTSSCSSSSSFSSSPFPASRGSGSASGARYGARMISALAFMATLPAFMSTP